MPREKLTSLKYTPWDTRQDLPHQQRLHVLGGEENGDEAREEDETR